MTVVDGTSSCGLCVAEDSAPLVEFDGFVIQQCQECGAAAVVQKPAVTDNHDAQYAARYARESRPEKAASCWLLTRELTDDLRGVTRLLDLGCGTGGYLDLARARGIETTGIEIAPTQAEHARSRGHTVMCGSAEDRFAALAGSADAVTCWDLLEHVGSPRRVLESAHAALAPGGRLIILTPMMGSLYDRLGIASLRATAGRCDELVRMCWSHEHLFRFHGPGLAAVLEGLGFHSVRARSILQLSLGAERYAGGEILPAWTGFRSLNRILSLAGVAAARGLRLHNKILVDAIKAAA